MTKRLFTEVRIIDGLGGILEDGWILVNRGRIESLGGQPFVPSEGQNDIEVMKLKGKTLLPGLIDCHVHLAMDSTPDPITRVGAAADSEAVLKMAANGLKTLKAGFTTVRDLGSKNFIDVHLRNAVEEGLTKGPRIACAGQMICITGGHAHQIGCIADGRQGVRKAVRIQVGAGVNWVKFMATGGVLTRSGTPGQPHFNRDELCAGVEEAHKMRVRTAAHCQSLEGSTTAVHAGIDSIEHGVGLDDGLVEEMARRGTFLVPTLSAPANILEKGEAAGIPREFVDKTKRLFDEHVASFQRAVKAGVKIAMGTDAGTPFNRHGENAGEIMLLTEHGLSAHQAIQCATSRAAELLDMQESVGSIAQGREADFIVVDGNPLDDISILLDPLKIHAVFRKGRMIRTSIKPVTE